MMRLCSGRYDYGDSAEPVWMHCVFCYELFLDKLGIHAVSVSFTGCGRVARRDRLATIFVKWIASPACLSFQENYGRGEAEGTILGTPYRPVDALVFPPPAAP